MRDRSLLGALLLIGLVVPLTSCNSSPSLTSISVTPAVMNFGGAGLTTQLTAIGSYTHPGHPAITKDITSQVTWKSATIDCVTVNSTGLITSQDATCSNIPVTASSPGFNGDITASMTVNVTISSGGGGGGNPDVTVVNIIPSSQAVASPNQTAQFVAVGKTGTGDTVDVTSQSVWNSSSPSIATVTNTGLATGVNKGSATITAIFSNADGSVATGTAAFTVLGGASEPFTALTILPGTLTLSAIGQTGQFIALATSGATGLTEDVTNSPNLTWSSAVPGVASVTSYPTAPEGLVMGAGVGQTTITAKLTNPADNTVITNTASVTVSSSTGAEPLLSLIVVPAGITVSNKGQTGQYLAFGTFSATPTVRDMTNQVTWISLLPEVASVQSTGVAGEVGGLATAQGYTGNSVIYAEATNPDGTVVLSNPQTFTCNDPTTNSCNQTIAHPQFATVTVYNAGENTTTWQVTAPSDTGTPNLIHCGPGWTLNGGAGGSVCVGTYETGTTVVLTESPTGAGFGGWSSGDGAPGVGCQEPNLLTSPTCTVTLTGNTSIGAIFY